MTKTANIEEIGGAASIIVDNVKEESTKIVMADDGRGYLINIPSFIISQKSGRILIENILSKPKS